MSCFSNECGLCSSCSGDVGKKIVKYLQPREFYKMDTGKDPPPLPRDREYETYHLYQLMMLTSEMYRKQLRHPAGRWEKLCRGLIRRKKNRDMYKPNGTFWSIYNSHVEFVKGCTEEGVIYGKNRCLRPENSVIYSMIRGGKVDINSLGGKVMCKGGGLFDLDILRKQMNLSNEDYEKYFDKFQTYIDEVNVKMKEYNTTLGENYRGKVPEFINIGDDKYTLWDDHRVMCDDPECALMTHCMINWDEDGNYTGTRPPAHGPNAHYYYGPIIGSIPKYTKNKSHELCILCALRKTDTECV